MEFFWKYRVYDIWNDGGLGMLDHNFFSFIGLIEFAINLI